MSYGFDFAIWLRLSRISTHCTIRANGTTREVVDLRGIDLRFLSYNNQNLIDLRDNAFLVEYRERKDIMRDFDQIAFIKKQERARINYQKKKNQSVVIMKEKGQERSREIVPGMKFLQILTNQGMLDLNIK